MKVLSKITTLQMLRNVAHINYRYGKATLGEVDQAENNLSIQLNQN
jgi:hypothetical protein